MSAFLASCLLVVAILVGCGGGGDNPQSPTPVNGNTTTIATVTASPNPAPPTVTYKTFPYPAASPGTSTAVTGVRGVDNSSNVYITATYPAPQGVGDFVLFYVGPALGGGVFNILNYPSSPGTTVTGTSAYGPNNGANGNIQITGSYNTTQAKGSLGFFYEGPVDGSGNWRTLTPTSSAGATLNTISHSTMGGLVVGNFDTDLATGRAFVYDSTANVYTELIKPGAVSITAYGIWHNGGTSYTIAGGYSDANVRGLDIGYIVDWNSATRTASHWTSFSYKDQPLSSIVSHFEGITTDGTGGYNMAADFVAVKGGTGAAFAHVPRSPSGGFGFAVWTDIAFPSAPGATVVTTSANTVYQNNVYGIYVLSGSSAFNPYVATVKP